MCQNKTELKKFFSSFKTEIEDNSLTTVKLTPILLLFVLKDTLKLPSPSIKPLINSKFKLVNFIVLFIYLFLF